jgi:HicA toxin of bacterial toxin-antitoxin,
VKLREVVRGLRALGFERVTQKGSHAKYRHANGGSVMVPTYRRDHEFRDEHYAEAILAAARRKAS